MQQEESRQPLGKPEVREGAWNYVEDEPYYREVSMWVGVGAKAARAINSAAFRTPHDRALLVKLGEESSLTRAIPGLNTGRMVIVSESQMGGSPSAVANYSGVEEQLDAYKLAMGPPLAPRVYVVRPWRMKERVGKPSVWREREKEVALGEVVTMISNRNKGAIVDICLGTGDYTPEEVKARVKEAERIIDEGRKKWTNSALIFLTGICPPGQEELLDEILLGAIREPISHERRSYHGNNRVILANTDLNAEGIVVVGVPVGTGYELIFTDEIVEDVKKVSDAADALGEGDFPFVTLDQVDSEAAARQLNISGIKLAVAVRGKRKYCLLIGLKGRTILPREQSLTELLES